MFCRDIMYDNPHTVRADAPLAEAMALLMDRHIQEIFVIDEQQVYLGELTAIQLTKILLPPDQSGLPHFGSESHAQAAKDRQISDLQARLQPYLHRPVKNYMDTNLPIVQPDTPFADALLLLRGGILRLPVVEQASRKLVGSISVLSVLGAIDAKSIKP